MIAAQQLPQNYVGQGGGTAGFMKDLQTTAAGALQAITPHTAGIAGLTAGVALGAIAYSGYLISTKEVETAASGLGRAVAGSTAEMEAAAQAGAAAAGMSVTSARSMEAQFLRTGLIGSENFEQLISISKDFGATVGLDADAAGAALAEMFADPAKAAQTLFQQYGLIDAATARQATILAKQNRESEAQALLLKALPDQLANAEEATTKLGRAWQNVGNFASNAFDKIGSVINRAEEEPSLEDQIALVVIDSRYTFPDDNGIYAFSTDGDT
ncbi:phage tail length tape measure family protein [Rhizobium sp. NFR12]|uniref:phage tail length tape measure family protein n=1 Tax=Rhizobium sp. NFR12 TaxID=1566261 RepID=UPI0008A7CE98|nr:phage tail length tape measure family protein [Rhizobium sp. NFR12]SEH27827.1 Prophage tail length tape measure protein [Rhizobium sp. NFR12]